MKPDDQRKEKAGARFNLRNTVIHLNVSEIAYARNPSIDSGVVLSLIYMPRTEYDLVWILIITTLLEEFYNALRKQDGTNKGAKMFDAAIAHIWS